MAHDPMDPQQGLVDVFPLQSTQVRVQGPHVVGQGHVHGRITSSQFGRMQNLEQPVGESGSGLHGLQRGKQNPSCSGDPNCARFTRARFLPTELDAT